MRSRLRKLLFLPLAMILLGGGLAGCSAESPFSLQGKPKLAGPRCASSDGCPKEAPTP